MENIPSDVNYDKELIKLITLLDVYTRIGKFTEAKQITNKIFEINKEKEILEIEGISSICYGNLLLEENRIMESLVYYEKSLKTIKNIQNWNSTYGSQNWYYIYGSIWRELAIAKFGDKSCLKALVKYKMLALEHNYPYLVSLANCFYFIACYIFDVFEENMMKEFKKQVELIGLSEHIFKIKVICVLKNWNSLYKNNYEDILELMKKCQGIEGMPEIIYFYYEKFKNDLPKDIKNDMKSWIDKYIINIINSQKIFKEKIKENLEQQPLLNKYCCVGCEAKCCYDGVYLNEGEKEKINEFIKKYPEYFKNIPNEYIVDGTWVGMEDKRKTATKEHNYKTKDFPKHFTNTRCVFADDNGECILQRVATDNQLHPWHVKPRSCWSFPIRGCKNGKLIPPPNINEKDPDFIDEEYPGYVSYLPCGKAVEDGTSWKDLLNYEIEYYKYLLNKGEI